MNQPLADLPQFEVYSLPGNQVVALQKGVPPPPFLRDHMADAILTWKGHATDVFAALEAAF
jgi:predicted ATP-grasp superfamily ATP-dependent carboligase